MRNILRDVLAYIRVKQIEAEYKCTLPKEVKRIISHCDEPILFEGGFQLFIFRELMKDYYFDFKAKGFLPIARHGSEFIVYHLDSHMWVKLDIVSNTILEKRRNFRKLVGSDYNILDWPIR